MKTLAVVWIGGSAMLVGYFLVRSALLQHRLKAAQRLLLENDWTEALIENAWRLAVTRQKEGMARLYKDLHIKPVGPRVQPVEIAPHGTIVEGTFVRASCPEEAAEIVSQSVIFRPRSAA